MVPSEGMISSHVLEREILAAAKTILPQSLAPWTNPISRRLSDIYRFRLILPLGRDTALRLLGLDLIALSRLANGTKIVSL